MHMAQIPGSILESTVPSEWGSLNVGKRILTSPLFTQHLPDYRNLGIQLLRSTFLECGNAEVIMS